VLVPKRLLIVAVIGRFGALALRFVNQREMLFLLPTRVANARQRPASRAPSAVFSLQAERQYHRACLSLFSRSSLFSPFTEYRMLEFLEQRKGNS
jgi:hypothetical protein